MSLTLSILVLRAQNPEQTRDFYASLGLHFEQEQHDSGPLHYAAEVEGVVLEIYPLKSDQMQPDTSTMLGFEFESFEDVLSNLNVDTDIKSSSDGLRYCSLKDPDGRTVRLSECPDD